MVYMNRGVGVFGAGRGGGLGWILTVLRTTARVRAAAATYITAAGVRTALTPAHSKHH